MTFEEFFKKKKIDLIALEKGESALFSEFKTHYEQMGEKSFDHTKKYWFNKLRLRFPAPIEVKVEKPIVAAPQVENATLSAPPAESTPPPVNIGFKPKFRAGVTKSTSAENTATPKADEPEKEPQVSENATEAKPAYKPKFNMKNIKPKGEE